MMHHGKIFVSVFKFGALNLFIEIYSNALVSKLNYQYFKYICTLQISKSNSEIFENLMKSNNVR